MQHNYHAWYLFVLLCTRSYLLYLIVLFEQLACLCLGILQFHQMIHQLLEIVVISFLKRSICFIELKKRRLLSELILLESLCVGLSDLIQITLLDTDNLILKIY